MTPREWEDRTLERLDEMEHDFTTALQKFLDMPIGLRNTLQLARSDIAAIRREADEIEDVSK